MVGVINPPAYMDYFLDYYAATASNVSQSKVNYPPTVQGGVFVTKPGGTSSNSTSSATASGTHRANYTAPSAPQPTIGDAGSTATVYGVPSYVANSGVDKAIAGFGVIMAGIAAALLA